jgi:hypothetical protein
MDWTKKTDQSSPKLWSALIKLKLNKLKIINPRDIES